MEVNFKELKRKNLQRLCKKHGLRANTTNAQMADSLISLFKICENNKQETVFSNGFGANMRSKVEEVEDEEKHGFVLQTTESKSSQKCPVEVTRLKFHEENGIIFLDEEDEETSPVLRSADKKKYRRINSKAGKVYEPSRINEADQTIGVLRNPNEGILVPVRITRSRLMNSKVAQSPVVEKVKSREGRQEASQNVMMEAGDVRIKRKRKSGDFSIKVNDEIMIHLPIDVSASENSACGSVDEKELNSTQNGISLSIDGNKLRECNSTQNDQDIEEHELCAAGNLMEEVPENVGTQSRKKRTRACLEEDILIIESEIDKSGFPHEIVDPEVCFGSSQVLGSPSLSNLASSRPCLTFSELQSGHDEIFGGHFPVTYEPLGVQSVSLDRNEVAEMEGSLLCKNSIIAGTTMVEVDDTFGRRLSISELDHVSNDGETSKQSSAIVLSYSHGHYDNKECFGSVSATHVGNLQDNSNKVFIAEAHYNGCGETPVSMNNLGSSSEQGCKTRQECQDFQKVRGGEEVEKRYKLLKDLEGNNEKENGSEAYNDRFIWNCDLKKTSPIILCHEWIVEDISNIASPANEKPAEMSNSSRLLGSIDRHDDHKVLYLAESNSKNVAREECQVVVEKQIEDMKTLVDRFGESLKENASIELECITETPKKSGLNISGNKFQEKAADYGTVLQELYQIKDGGPFQMEGNAHINPEKLKHDGENFLGSEESQAVGYDEDSEIKNVSCNSPKEVEETVPFELSKRLDNLVEKLLCLKKVIRGEIAPLITDLSLPCEVDISCEESSATNKKESFPSHEQESQILNAMCPTNHVQEDHEQDSSNSEVDILNKIDEVFTLSSPEALQKNPELWKSMKIYERNETDAASPSEDHFYVRPNERKPSQDGDIYERQFLEIDQGVIAKSGETFEGNEFVSPGKPSSFCLEDERSSRASCIPTSKLNNSMTSSPTKYINHFETKCLSETVDARSSLKSTEAYTKHTVNMLKIESHDDVVITTMPETLQGNLELLKCMESCKQNNTDEASYESDCNYICPAEVDSCQGGDIDDMDFIEITPGATANPREALEKIKLVSPIKKSHIKSGSERNSCASCSSDKRSLNNNITNSPLEDIKHFGSHCLSETLGSQSSLTIKQTLAKHTVDVFKMEAQEEIPNTSSGDASQGKEELFKCMESCAAKNSDVNFPYEYDFSYNFHAVREPNLGDDIDVTESLNIDQFATTKPGEVLEKIKFLSPSKPCDINLDNERNFCAIGIYKKAQLNNDTTNRPAKDTIDCGTQWLSKSSDVNHSVSILEVESQEGSILGADTLVDAVPYEVKASFESYTIDPIEEICDKLIKFCVSSSQKAAKSNIINTPITTSAGFSHVGFIRDKENTQSSKTNQCSNRKIRKSASAGSIRRPLQSVTNQMIE